MVLASQTPRPTSRNQFMTSRRRPSRALPVITMLVIAAALAGGAWWMYIRDGSGAVPGGTA